MTRHGRVAAYPSDPIGPQRSDQHASLDALAISIVHPRRTRGLSRSRCRGRRGRAHPLWWRWMHRLWWRPGWAHCVRRWPRWMNRLRRRSGRMNPLRHRPWWRPGWAHCLRRWPRWMNRLRRRSGRMNPLRHRSWWRPGWALCLRRWPRWMNRLRRCGSRGLAAREKPVVSGLEARSPRCCYSRLAEALPPRARARAPYSAHPALRVAVRAPAEHGLERRKLMKARAGRRRPAAVVLRQVSHLGLGCGWLGRA